MISFISTFVTKQDFDSGKKFCAICVLAHSTRDLVFISFLGSKIYNFKKF